MNQKELAATALSGLDLLDVAPTVQLVKPQAFQHTDGRVNRGVRGAVWALAIPSAVRHLLLEEVADDGVEAGIFVLEVRKDREDHPCDAGFAAPHPFSPGAIVDTAVRLDPTIEEERASFSRLPVARRQTKVTEQ